MHAPYYASPVRFCQFAVCQPARHLTETCDDSIVSCVCLFAAAAAPTFLFVFLATPLQLYVHVMQLY